MSAFTIELACLFNDMNLTTITYKGRRCWVARQIGSILGYSKDGQQFAGNVSKGWSESFTEGADFVVLSGKPLHDFKALTKGDTAGVSPFASRVMLLFASGRGKALERSRKPLAKKLRDWCSGDLASNLKRAEEARTQSFNDPPEAETLPPSDDLEPADLDLRGPSLSPVTGEGAHGTTEQRLWLKESRLSRDQDEAVLRRRVRGFHGLSKEATAAGFDKPVVARIRMEACALEAGIDLESFMLKALGTTEVDIAQEAEESTTPTRLPSPRVKDDARWYSPTTMAELLNVDRNMVGRAITMLGLRHTERPDLSRQKEATVQDRRGMGEIRVCYLYKREVYEAVRAYLLETGKVIEHDAPTLPGLDT